MQIPSAFAEIASIARLLTDTYLEAVNEDLKLILRN